MNNDSETITANEVNKYTYCPYQFYYDRLYGQRYIRLIRKDMLKNLGYDDTTKSNFKRGLDYHKNYKPDDAKKYPIFKLIVIVILIVLGIAFYEQLYLFIFNIYGFFGIS